MVISGKSYLLAYVVVQSKWLDFSCSEPTRTHNGQHTFSCKREMKYADRCPECRISNISSLLTQQYIHCFCQYVYSGFSLLRYRIQTIKDLLCNNYIASNRTFSTILNGV